MISKMAFRCIGFFCVCSFLATVGCSSMSTLRKPDLTVLLPPGPAETVSALWTPAIQTGEQPQRGFGGRVYFYDNKEKKPIKVDGTIAVYAFDETNRKPNDNEPSRVYTFAKEDVKKSYTKSKLGHSYNLWIPWDADGPDGDAKKISFFVRYIPDKGDSIISQQVTSYLVGKNITNETLAKNEQNNIQQTTFNNTEKFIDAMRQQPENLTNNPENLPHKLNNYTEHLIETNNNRPKKMKTTTINLKPNLESQQ
ncbi:MAG: hypothetical protein LBC74_06465 [Planctomycetaceae bacterium]|jgi:hypothetical protein|nr:hypothetical protein [Planctomycetaceae bacterium]